ncbi:hypothetical protein [Thermomonospora catenispora]|uniref:hypothetical protein n=1 Tax=Thermomonospora catenispora TaxID=2493090 RepID=UPI001120E001|nr:hypothetical protein [Thermomonospora catenispora]TNY34462.1 hypothetical protein EIO00_23660 [Thermomonospora catenispora]
MTNPAGRLGALTTVLLLFAAVFAGPAAAREHPAPSVRSAVVRSVADDGPQEETERKELSGAARWVVIGSGLLMGVGIGFMVVFLRRGSSSGE